MRVWVARSGPRPLTLSTLLTGKEGAGLRIWAAARWPLRWSRGARRRHFNRKKNGGPANPRVGELAGPWVQEWLCCAVVGVGRVGFVLLTVSKDRDGSLMDTAEHLDH